MPPTSSFTGELIESETAQGKATGRLSTELAHQWMDRHAARPDGEEDTVDSGDDPFCTEWVSDGITHKVTTPKSLGQPIHDANVAAGKAEFPPD